MCVDLFQKALPLLSKQFIWYCSLSQKNPTVHTHLGVLGRAGWGLWSVGILDHPWKTDPQNPQGGHDQIRSRDADIQEACAAVSYGEGCGVGQVGWQGAHLRQLAARGMGPASGGLHESPAPCLLAMRLQVT